MTNSTYQTPSTAILEQVREFVVSNFLYGEDTDLANSDSLVALSIVDSTGIMELVSFVESTFDITIEAEELQIENFESINKITSLVAGKKG